MSFNSAPVFAAGGGGGGFGGFGGFFGGGGGGGGGRGARDTTERRTGRGGSDERDFVQGRPRDMGAAGVEAFRAAQAEEGDGPGGGGQGAFGGGGANRNPVRVVQRFASDVNELLISGGLRNGRTLTNAPAVVDVTLGDGHVVLFSFNPFWRSHTHGSYALLFNTFMHFDALSADPEAVLAEQEGGTSSR